MIYHGKGVCSKKNELLSDMSYLRGFILNRDGLHFEEA